MTHLLGALPAPLGLPGNAGGPSGVRRTLRRLVIKAIRYRRRKQTAAALARLDARTLKDIGLHGGQIDYLAEAIARRGPMTVRAIMTAARAVALAFALALPVAAIAAEIPDSIAAAGETRVAAVQAQGA
ncbi:MAG: DUF1127 domain-containing protein [Pseudolabrys sp.]